jgi:hypothetical protein
MKIKTTKPNTSIFPHQRSFRRFVRIMFASLLGRQDGFQETVVGKLQNIEDMIEIMAREMARQATRNK